MQIDFVPDPELFPFESRWFESSVGRVHYIDEGSGPSVVFFHGNPTWSFLYRNVVTRLRDRFRCIAVDYPGFGLSVRPSGYGYTAQEHANVIGELIDHLALEDFIVMGHDWGGPIGTAVALERADRIRGLIYGNTWFWPLRAPNIRIFSRVMSSPPMQWAILRRNFFVKRLIPAGTTRKLSEEEMEHYRVVQPTPETRRGVAEFPRQLIAATPMLTVLEEQVPVRFESTPVLLIWGMRDIAFPPKAALPRLRSIFKDHQVVELRKARHYIQEDAPEQIADAIALRFGVSPPPTLN